MKLRDIRPLPIAAAVLAMSMTCCSDAPTPTPCASRSLAAYLNNPRRIYANFARRVLYGVRKAAEAVKPISDRNTDSGFANQNQICYNTDNKRESFVNTVPCDVCCAGGWWR